uniref:Uncharacterized protein n=1 Tax=Arundo donax TaxID=35708 RepID=A0A0A9CSR5_ARUDO
MINYLVQLRKIGDFYSLCFGCFFQFLKNRNKLYICILGLLQLCC